LQALKRRTACEIGPHSAQELSSKRRYGKIEGTGRRGGRRTQLLDDFKQKRRYRSLKQKTLDRTVWKIRYGGGYGPVKADFAVNECTDMNRW
jgi:hypothetical protein